MNISSFSFLKSLFFDNSTVRQTIFKNTAWATFSMAADRILRFFLLVYVARTLGAQDFGKFTFALAFISLFVVFHDFGLTSIIQREFSRGANKEDFYSLLSLKTLLILGTFLMVLAGSFFITQDPLIRKVILILALFSFVEEFTAVFYAFFQAFYKMEYRSTIEVLHAVFLAGFGFLVIFKFPSIENLSYGYLASAFLAFVLALVIFRAKFLPLKIAWRKEVWKKFLQMSWPLALMSLFGVLYGYIDSVIMGYRGQMAETGWYNAAVKITAMATVPAALISRSFSPFLSRFFQESKDKLQKAWTNQIGLMIVMAVPLVLGGWVLSEKIILAFYSKEFAPSVLALQILIVGAGFIILSKPFYDVLLSSNLQKKIFEITISAAALNIILNMILIPKYSLYGAAFASLMTNFLLLAMFIIYALKFARVSFFQAKFLITFFASVFCGFLMYLTINNPWVFNLNVFLSIILGGIVYLLSFGAIIVILKKLKAYEFSV